MKLMAVILFATCLQVSARGYSQITLSETNVPLQKVFKEIQRQSGYDFVCTYEILKESGKVSVNVRDVSLQKALEECLRGKPLTYVIIGKTVVVQSKEKDYYNTTKIVVPGTLLSPPVVIHGRVEDQQGKPLQNVSVLISGTMIGTTTNREGRFTITAPEGKNIVLEISSVGYLTKRVSMGKETEINITLEVDISDLNEVVVVGYGTQKKRDVTGSVGYVNVEDMAKAPVMSFGDALAGRVAGVRATSNDGQPGSEGFSITVRGVGSLTQNSSPLYVVDGVAIEDFDPSTLNMDDIKEFNVLKDASATAIYGARGANGVIVIETKRGTVGRPKVLYSTSLGFQDVTKRMDMMSPYEFVKYQLERNNYSDTYMRRYTPGDFPETDTVNYVPGGNTLEDYKKIKGIDWQDLIFQKGKTQIHSLSLSGGTNLTKYLISGSIYNMDGVLINTGSNRVTARLSLDQTINKKLKAGVNLSYSALNSFGNVSASNTGTAGHAYGYIMYSAWAFRPVTGRESLQDDIDEDFIDVELDPDAGAPSTASYINPVQILKNEDRKNKSTQLNASAYLNYTILKGLTLRTSGAYALSGGDRYTFYNENTTRGNPLLSDRGVQGSMGLINNMNWQSSTTLTYNKSFNKTHNLNIMAGTDFMERFGKSYGFNTQLIPFDDLGIVGMDDGIPISTNVTYADQRLNSVFGRINYAYKSKYMLTTTHRWDGSSKFAPQHRWAYFPSIGLAWRVKNEKFMKKVKGISDLKLRLGYGATGNNRVSEYAYESAIAYSIADSYSYGNADPVIGFAPTSLGNRDLKWESSYQTNIGLDLSLFNRINITIDAYRKITKDLLLRANIPWHLGFSSTYKNIGEIQNDGLEITLNTTNIRTKNFSWTSDFNISFNQNKILALTNNQERMISAVTWDALHNTSYLYVAEIDKPAAMFLGYVFDGIYQYSDFDTVGGKYILKPELPHNGGSSRASTQPGSIKYKDLNGDGTVDQFDETIIGDPMPIHIGGFNNNFTYKGFNLNVFFQWSYGNQVFNANRIYFEGGRPTNNRNQFATYANRWTPENQSNTYFKAGGQGPLGRYSSLYLEDGSFLRLKTIALSYTLPVKWVSKFAKSISLTASAQNLKTWTKYSGPDPEVSTRNTILTPGFDWSPYPRARIMVFGLKANF